MLIHFYTWPMFKIVTIRITKIIIILPWLRGGIVTVIYRVTVWIINVLLYNFLCLVIENKEIYCCTKLTAM